MFVCHYGGSCAKTVKVSPGAVRRPDYHYWMMTSGGPHGVEKLPIRRVPFPLSRCSASLAQREEFRTKMESGERKGRRLPFRRWRLGTLVHTRISARPWKRGREGKRDACGPVIPLRNADCVLEKPKSDRGPSYFLLRSRAVLTRAAAAANCGLFSPPTVPSGRRSRNTSPF